MNGILVRALGGAALRGILPLLAVLGLVAFAPQHSMALPASVQTAANLSPHVIAIPSLDGTGLYIQADQMPPATSVFFANVSVGPGHEKDAWSMTYTTTQEALTATALGFTPAESAYGSMNITGTIGGAFYSTNDLEFNRAYVPLSGGLISEWSPDGMVELRILPNTLTNDTYLLMMSSFAPPGATPRGAVLASPSYSIRLADPLAQTAAPVLLRMHLDGLPTPRAEWHSLFIHRWDANQARWVEVRTYLNAENRYLWAAVDRLTEYALIKAPSWLDEFEDLSGATMEQSQAIEIASVNGERGVSLAAGAAAGHITSQPISVTLQVAGWAVISFEGLVAPETTTLQVDLLAASGEVIASGLKTGDRIAIDPTMHPTLRLRAQLGRADGAASPILYRWRLDQEPASRLFVPWAAR